ncbi:hypothetical protein LVJ83_06095 [Uruburuella testudinis]|uniref:Cyclophilin-like domain-containing protein n=1 Tax=Uruburuella testudinis TaxID=1282863 RepID=A0ABY4DVG3_9NEIS|nr:cyclophilin-like fold protein [Uruburuella testudinis]UOO83028.1 hypothetical protein LVJ83_06095 [Uruburuella testudinis]
MKKRLAAITLALIGLALHPLSEAKEMKVKITLDNHVRYATLADNPAAQSLFAHLPLSLPLKDYAATEKVAYPNFKLNTSRAPARHRGRPGDITYYAPWGNLALFYQSGPEAAGLIYLGRFDSDYQPLLNAGHIKIEAAH